MNRIIGIAALLVLTFAFFVIGCTKENDNQPIQKSERIPIAKLTDGNKIEHLFLQKDVKNFYSKGNADVQGYSLKNAPDTELIFIEVVDEGNDGEDIGLLYRIRYEEGTVAETSIISSVLTLEENIYYYVPGGGGGVKVSCTTSDCSGSDTGCQPQSDNTCSKCFWGGTCTRTVSTVTEKSIGPITEAIEYAVSVYQSGD